MLHLLWLVFAIMAAQQVYDDGMAAIGGHKRYLSRLANRVEGFVGEVLDDEQVIAASQLCEQVTQRFAVLQGLFDELLGNEHLDDAGMNTFEDYMAEVSGKLAKLKRVIKVAVSHVEEPVGKKSAGLLDPAVKYPEIKLPSFSGGVTGTRDFRPFFQVFKALVEDKEDIPLVYKTQYLRACLPERSESYGLVAHIPPTAENYDLHMSTLVGRYGNDAGEANRIRRDLMKVSTWSVCNSLESQRKLVDHVKMNLSLLKQVDTVDDEEGMKTLALEILALLPERLKFKAAKLDKDERTVDVILELVEESIKDKLEVRSFSDSMKKHTDHSSRPPPPSRPQGYSYTSQGRSGKSSAPAKSMPCVYCGDDGHSPHTCTKKSKEDRAAVVGRGRRCWNCLSDQHQVRACPHPSRCQCKQKGKHSQSLCGIPPPWRARGQAYLTGGTGLNASDTSDGAEGRYLSTAVVDLPARKGGQVKVRLLLDQCATHSYMKESLVDQLQTVSGPAVDMSVNTFSGLLPLSARMVRFNLPMVGEISVIVKDSICEPMQGHQVSESSSAEMEGFPLSDPACVNERSLPIDILVGVDHYWKIVTDEIVRLSFNLVLVGTKFGYALSGISPLKSPRSRGNVYLAHTLVCGNMYGLNVQDTWYQSYAHTLCALSREKESSVEFIGPHCHEEELVDPSSDPDLEEVKCGLEKFWDLDTLGIKADKEISPILEDFQNSIVQDPATGRYTVNFPRKRNIVNLPCNYGSALQRLNGLKSKLGKPGNEEYSQKYVAIFKDQLDQGIIEKVDHVDMDSLKESGSSCCGEFYIPHHGVLKKGKLRVVMDGSASAYKGALSLNQCLSVGPSLINLLAEVLLTFRLHSVVLLADIMRAFLNVGVTVTDRDLLRFLWFDEEGNVAVYRFTRVPFGTGASPFLLNATLKHHFEKVVEDQTLLLLLSRSIYVDDILTGAETVEEVLKLRVELESVLEQAAMKLHGMDSNSAEVRKALGVEDEPDDKVILGVCWNRKRDDMGLNLEKILLHSRGAASKRELLRGTSKFFDPHGLYSPVVLLPKLMFQKVCSSRYGWDDPLPDGMAKEWLEWQEQLVLLEGMRVQRQALLPRHDRLELHGFADASQAAYAAVIYIVTRRGEESASYLIMCKNRVSPQKKLTIPRLELMGALLLARLMAVVAAFLKHLKIDAMVYYSDSMNVLYWLRSEHRMWAVFVACRIKEINALSSSTSWKYVPTGLNPADIATRGMKPSELKESRLWWHGPEFLLTGRADPEVDASCPTTACLQEKKKVVNVVVQAPVERGVGVVIKAEDWSSFQQLLKRTVIYLQLCFWFAGKYSLDAGDRFKFSVPELYGKARQMWVKFVQQESYPVEIKFLKNNPVQIPCGMKVPSSLLRQLDLFLDSEGILRARTRLRDAVVSDSVKYPVLLSKDHHVTQLLIKETHLRLCHAGVRQVLSSLREFYWIPHGRRTVAKVVKSCFNCRKESAAFYPIPDPPPMPDFRLAKVEAFDHVGLDHCGPFHLKEGRKIEKVYILILTCAVSRAVHLELVRDMSTKQFMFGFRRFVSRRGLPSFILSDNSLTFKCASAELTAILNSPKFQQYLNGRNIRWQRYLEYSPWWGGFIERLNHGFKSSIRKVLGGSQVSFDELQTLLTEVEAIMNSRPISYVYDDAGEGQAITPSLLLCGKNLTQLPANMFDHKFERKQPQTCRERLKYIEKMKTYFWTRWTREYLTELSERHLAGHKGHVREPKVGDIVLVKEGGDTVKVPRHKWLLGKVIQLYEGRDGKVRSVDVRLVQSAEKTPNLVRHKSPRHLVPLECED